MDLGHLPVRASEINTQASTSAIHSLRFRKRTQSSLVSEYMFIAGNLKNREKPKTEVACALGRLLKRGRQRGLFLQHRGLRQCGARGGGSSGSPPGLAPAPSSPPPVRVPLAATSQCSSCSSYPTRHLPPRTRMRVRSTCVHSWCFFAFGPRTRVAQPMTSAAVCQGFLWHRPAAFRADGTSVPSHCMQSVPIRYTFNCH